MKFPRMLILASFACALVAGASRGEEAKPNVILLMADDLGWGDTGYNGHPVIKTPHLDDMAKSGLRFDRFYAAAPVCSPTRGSCLTGRHPYRYGITFANVGHMLPPEATLAERLRPLGYATGHFGKWHLGTLTVTEKDANRGGPKGKAHFAPPWKHGFDVCFSTESKVPTFDPMKHPRTGKPYGTHYWKQHGGKVVDNLDGDDSRIIMDRALPFIERSVQAKKPFLAVIWFHAPHLPVVAGPKHRKLYADQPENLQHYYGCISALDDQVGRLRSELRRLGVADNTLLWFASDNGPEGRKGPGSAGPFRGRKRDLYEGGVRVAGLLEWPARIKQPRIIKTPCCTSDYYPTILAVLGQEAGKPAPHDGVNLVALIDGKMKERPTPLGFQSGQQLALSDNRYKLIRPSAKADFELYDLIDDPGEKKNLAARKPDLAAKMKGIALRWQQSCKESAAGKDY